MSAQGLGVFDIWDRAACAFVDATLFRPITDRHVEDFVSLWKPFFAKCDDGRSGASDVHWNWAQRQEAGPAVAERDPMVRTAVWLVVASATVICVLVAAL